MGWTILFFTAVAIYFVYALFRFESAMLWLPFFIPLYLWKVEVKGIPFTLIECFSYAVLLAYLVRLIYNHFFKRRERCWCENMADLVKLKKEDNFPWKFFVLLVLVVAASIYSTLIVPEKSFLIDGVTPFMGRNVALGMLKGWIVVPITMFVLFFTVIKKPKTILTMFNTYTLSAVFLSLYALYQVITDSYITPDARASGPFESANYLALYISPAVLYSLIRIKEAVVGVADPEKGILWKIHFKRRGRPVENVSILAFLGAFLVLFIALLFSKSYAAILAVGVSVIVFFGLEYYEFYKAKLKLKFPWKKVFWGVMVVAVLALLVYILDPEKWEEMFNFASRNSSSVRLQVYTIACHLLMTHGISGIGLGQFPLVYQHESLRVLGELPYELNMPHPHNFYVALILNIGLVGFMGIMWLIYMALKEACSRFKSFAWSSVDSISKIRVISFCMLLIILIHGMFDTPFFKNDLAMLFWIIIAGLLVPVEEN